jgi:glycosyltransferase involved in cell wall biosynthesis
MRELARREGVELFVAHQAPVQDAPFEEGQFSWIEDRLQWRSVRDLSALGMRLDGFEPDILLFVGWAVPEYRRVARAAAGRCFRIMTMDNCWLATVRQRVATWIAPFYVQPLADAVWLPGERQAIFARKLGFAEHQIHRGLYSCDQSHLAAVHSSRISESRPVPRSFLFIGRFVPDKGIDVLVQAYQGYRTASEDPWPLVCCGTGPLRDLLKDKPGIHVEGFVQPELLGKVLGTAGCLVLPSRFEAWGVVVHEAASAGLPILASNDVGASVHLVQDGYNGYVFDSKDIDALASLMVRFSALSNARLDAMSRASYLLSQQYSPSHWADTLQEAPSAAGYGLP